MIRYDTAADAYAALDGGSLDAVFGAGVLDPADIKTLQYDSRCDNVLLEYILALEQKERGKVQAIYPVFVGEVQDDSSQMSDFFATGGRPALESRSKSWRPRLASRADSCPTRRDEVRSHERVVGVDARSMAVAGGGASSGRKGTGRYG